MKTLVIQDALTKDLLFAGEIKQATGSLIKVKKNFDTILFTDNPKMIEKIIQNDWLE